MNTTKTGLDIQSIIESKIEEQIQSGAIEKMVETQLTKMMSGVIENALSSYEDIADSVKKIMKEKLEINLDALQLSSYSTMMVRVIEESAVGILEVHKQKMKDTISSILAVPEKQNWKLSEIVNKYRGQLYENPELVLQIKLTDYGHTWVNIGEKQESTSRYSSNQSYDIKMIIDKKTNIISNVWYKEDVVDSRKTKIYNHSIEAWLASLWMNSCTIEIDEDDAEYEATKEAYED
jgi:hypothetical protein